MSSILNLFRPCRRPLVPRGSKSPSAAGVELEVSVQEGQDARQFFETTFLKITIKKYVIITSC